MKSSSLKSLLFTIFTFISGVLDFLLSPLRLQLFFYFFGWGGGGVVNALKIKQNHCAQWCTSTSLANSSSMFRNYFFQVIVK
jgi:hypothetical protein